MRLNHILTMISWKEVRKMYSIFKGYSAFAGSKNLKSCKFISRSQQNCCFYHHGRALWYHGGDLPWYSDALPSLDVIWPSWKLRQSPENRHGYRVRHSLIHSWWRVRCSHEADAWGKVTYDTLTVRGIIGKGEGCHYLFIPQICHHYQLLRIDL